MESIRGVCTILVVGVQEPWVPDCSECWASIVRYYSQAEGTWFYYDTITDPSDIEHLRLPPLGVKGRQILPII